MQVDNTCAQLRALVCNACEFNCVQFRNSCALYNSQFQLSCALVFKFFDRIQFKPYGKQYMQLIIAFFRSTKKKFDLNFGSGIKSTELH